MMRPLRIRMVTAARRGTRTGNRVSAERWASILRKLGHRVDYAPLLGSAEASRKMAKPVSSVPRVDVLFALHARASAAAMRIEKARSPGAAVIVALTGTDLYVDFAKGDTTTVAAMRSADRLIALQPHALTVLPKELAAKTVAIFQSVAAPGVAAAPRKRTFDVCVVGHLRKVKDPMRTAMAARALPESSRVAVVHLGGILESAFRRAVAKEVANNPRYRWLGERPRWEAKRWIGRSRVMVISSRSEGGAHVIAEAVVAGTPVLASRVSGNIGMLGEDYPGYFEFGDTDALRSLLLELERDPRFYKTLKTRCKKLASQFDPAREWRALAQLVDDVTS